MVFNIAEHLKVQSTGMGKLWPLQWISRLWLSYYPWQAFLFLGYPLNVAPRELTDFMYGVFSSCPKNFLEAYLNWTVNDACRTYISQRKGL